MPLFRISASGKAQQINKTRPAKEREIHSLCEANLEPFFGVRFVAREFSTGQKHAGRIDTLGLDTDGSPVIIEYKKTENENIINQGLFYMDWLTDHKGDFEIKAKFALGQKTEVNWERPRLILIAESFNKYDLYAVNKIGQFVELYVYRIYEENLVYFESVNSPVESQRSREKTTPTLKPIYSLNELLGSKPTETQQLFKALQTGILNLNKAVEEKILKHYVAYQSSKNFCEIVIQNKRLNIHLDIPIKKIEDPKNICEDISHKGHWATGNTVFSLASEHEIEYALKLIRQSLDATL